MEPRSDEARLSVPQKVWQRGSSAIGGRGLRRRGRLRVLVLTVIATVMLAACGDAVSDGGGDTSGGADQVGDGAAGEGEGADGQALAVGLPDASGEPEGEQSLVYVASQVPVQSYDPAYPTNIVSTADYLNIYGALARYDAETLEFSPWLAESIEPDDEFSMWTVTLREGMTFTDGTPYDADAVVMNVERHLDPTIGARSSLRSFVTSVNKVDDTTVEFQSIEPWTQFPYVLAGTGGMIAAPAYLDAIDGGDTNTLPVGAGPFTPTSWAPGSPLETRANPDFFDGEPVLETVIFRGSSDTNSMLDAYDSGQVDALNFAGIPEALQRAVDGDLPGYEWPNAYTVGIFYNLEDGRLFNEHPELRRAINLALDRDVMNDFAYLGQFSPDSTLWSSQSPMWPQLEPFSVLEPDVAEAQRLVEEAKSNGYDGQLDLLVCTCADSPGLAARSQLAEVGIDVNLDLVDLTTYAERAHVQHNFEAVVNSVPMSAEVPWPSLQQTFHSDSPRNWIGVSSAELDEAIRHMRLAETDEERYDIAAEIQQMWTEDPPSAISASQALRFVVKPDVKGLSVGLQQHVYLHEAFRSSTP